MDEQLRRIQLAELEILDQIHEFCKKNGLRYSLAYGTLIGAVRHGGFIPWDDDIDIVMPREDYNKLLSIWPKEANPQFLLQNKNTHTDFNQNFTKIRKDHTAFLQFEFEKKATYPTGFFVDIFPGDRIAPQGVKRRFQYFNCAISLLYSREGVTSKKDTLPEKVLMKVPRALRLKIRNWCDRNIQKWNNTEHQYFFPSTILDAKVYYPADLFDNMSEIMFAGKKYMCVRDYDTFLRLYYGDYMQLPPEEKRVLTHHPIFIDFSENYSGESKGE